MPRPLSKTEAAALIANTIADLDVAGMQDMGKAMAVLKPKIQGRVDMGRVGGLVRDKLE